MKLLTKELIAEFEKQGYTDGKPKDQVRVIAKYFIGGCTWYAVEWIPEDGVFYGYVNLNDPMNAELGYFSLQEFEQYNRTHPFQIERDLHCGFEHTLAEAVAEVKALL